MELLLKREPQEKVTFGKLYVDGVYECETLEDPERSDDKDGKVEPEDKTLEATEKIYGETAIGRGRYEVIINHSNRFKEYMPLLLKVPHFEGVRIHPGNKVADTHGCILVGKKRSGNTITESRNAYNLLMIKLKTAERKGKIFLTIE